LRERADLTVARPQQFILDQPVRTDEQRVPGERRQGLIRRVAVTGGTERQRLPPALAGFVKAVDPRQRRRSHIADAVRRGQRRDVQQQAGAAVFRRKRRQSDILAAHACPFAKFSALFTIPSASLTIAFRCDWSLKLSA